MKLKNESGVTLIILIVSIILIVILVGVSMELFDTSIFNDIENTQEKSNQLKSIQDREIENAINGLGGLEE